MQAVHFSNITDEGNIGRSKMMCLPHLVSNLQHPAGQPGIQPTSAGNATQVVCDMVTKHM
jgi:hypothetical protein